MYTAVQLAVFSNQGHLEPTPNQCTVPQHMWELMMWGFTLKQPPTIRKESRLSQRVSGDACRREQETSPCCCHGHYLLSFKRYWLPYQNAWQYLWPVLALVTVGTRSQTHFILAQFDTKLSALWNQSEYHPSATRAALCTLLINSLVEQSQATVSQGCGSDPFHQNVLWIHCFP